MSTEQNKTARKHALKALSIVEECHVENKRTNWRRACELTCDALLSDYSGQIVEFWSLALKKLKFPTSKQGAHSMTSYLNPFLAVIDFETRKECRNDQEMHNQFRAWELENIETLTLDLIGKKLNQFLDEAINIDPFFKLQHNVCCPAKPSSIRRWKEDLKFYHFTVKKTCVIFAYEKEDVKKHRKDCIKNKN